MYRLHSCPRKVSFRRSISDSIEFIAIMLSDRSVLELKGKNCINLIQNRCALSRHNTSEEDRLFQNSQPKSAFGSTIVLYRILADNG